jgi:hypothetical protein
VRAGCLSTLLPGGSIPPRSTPATVAGFEKGTNMNKWELTYALVLDVLGELQPTTRVQHTLIARTITQKLVDEGIIQSTVENDLRGDVS